MKGVRILRRRIGRGKWCGGGLEGVKWIFLGEIEGPRRIASKRLTTRRDLNAEIKDRDEVQERAMCEKMKYSAND